MENKIIELLNDDKKALSKLSIKTYASCINQIMKIINCDDLEILNSKPDFIIKVINDNWTNYNTRKIKYISVIVLLKTLYDKPNVEKYTKQIEAIISEVNGELSKNLKTDKQKKGWLDKDETEDLKTKLYKAVPNPMKIRSVNELKAFRDYILFVLYDDLPTRAELANAKIIFKKNKQKLNEDYNWIVLDKRAETIQYINNRYKTAGKYGQKILDINKNLYDDFELYKDAVDNFNSENWFLLNNTATSKMTPNRLSVVYKDIGKAIGKPLSITTNRHVKISELVPIQQMKTLADRMGNSTDQQIHTYAKE
jgi:hypothetical protein